MFIQRFTGKSQTINLKYSSNEVFVTIFFINSNSFFINSNSFLMFLAKLDIDNYNVWFNIFRYSNPSSLPKKKTKLVDGKRKRTLMGTGVKKISSKQVVYK